MSLNIKKQASAPIPPLEDGVYLGILVRIVDLGEQRFMDKDKWSLKVQLMFEICGEDVDINGEKLPRSIVAECSASLYDGKGRNGKQSKLRGYLEGWLGRELTELESEGGYDLS